MVPVPEGIWMADQAQPGGFDVRKLVEQSASKSTLQELAKRGIHRVKVLDEQMINKLIKDAVSQVLVSKTNLVSDADREKLVQASRAELDKLMKEFQQSKDKAELVVKDKESLAGEVENLQKQLQLQRQLSETLGKQRFEDGKGAAKAEIESLKEKVTQAEQAAREKLEGEFQKKMSAEMERMSTLSKHMETAVRSGGEEGIKKAVAARENELKAEFADRERKLRGEIDEARKAGAKEKESELKAAFADRERELKAQFQSKADDAAARVSQQKDAEYSQKMMAEMQKNVELSQKLTSTLEEMRQRDDEVAKKMEQLFTKSIEGLSKKLADLKLRSIAGGGGGGGGGGDVDAGAFRQSEDVIKHMLANELESNVKNMEKVEGKTAGTLGSALDRLKAMRGGAPKPPADDKDKK
jgi:hypothetical protein